MIVLYFATQLFQQSYNTATAFDHWTPARRPIFIYVNTQRTDDILANLQCMLHLRDYITYSN